AYHVVHRLDVLRVAYNPLSHFGWRTCGSRSHLYLFFYKHYRDHRALHGRDRKIHPRLSRAMDLDPSPLENPTIRPSQPLLGLSTIAELHSPIVVRLSALNSGERRQLACAFRLPAKMIIPSATAAGCRLAACAP